MTQRMTAVEWKQMTIGKAVELYTNKTTPGPQRKKTRLTSIERTEHEIQSNILERLNYLKNAFFWRENSGAFALEHNGKKRFFRAGTPGIADIMGIWNGTPVAIEVKRPKTKKNVSVDQKAFLKRFSDCGGVAIVCWDDDTVVQQLKDELNENT